MFGSKTLQVLTKGSVSSFKFSEMGLNVPQGFR